MISLTETAITKVRSMAQQYEMAEQGVRLMVVGGGCSGLSYDMDFESAPRDGDEVFECDGLKVYVDPMSLAYLDGTKVDYVETFTFSGFHFENPNAQKSCGCGSSFTV
jgi:iron-sulfur cluster insertion protein